MKLKEIIEELRAQAKDAKPPHPDADQTVYRLILTVLGMAILLRDGPMAQDDGK